LSLRASTNYSRWIYLPWAYSLVMGIIMILFNEQAGCSELVITPSFNLREDYNDNILFVPTNEAAESDYITIFSPGLNITSGTEFLNARLFSQLSRLIYQKNDDFNATDYNHQLNLGYRFSENTGFSAEALLKKDSSPEREISDISGVLLGISPHRTRSYGFTMDRSFSEKTDAALTLAHSWDSYSDPSSVDSVEYSASLGVNHFLSPATIGHFTIGYLFYDTSDMQAGNGTCMVGFKHDLTERTSLSLDAGGRYTTTRFEAYTVGSPERESWWSTGMVAQATISYLTDVTVCTLSASHGLVSLSGSEGLPERTSIKLIAREMFPHDISAELRAEYDIDRSDRGELTVNDLDEDLWSVQPLLRYGLTKEIALEASYRTTHYKSNTHDERSERGLYTLRFSWNHPITY